MTTRQRRVGSCIRTEIDHGQGRLLTGRSGNVAAYQVAFVFRPIGSLRQVIASSSVIIRLVYVHSELESLGHLNRYRVLVLTNSQREVGRNVRLNDLALDFF